MKTLKTVIKESLNNNIKVFIRKNNKKLQKAASNRSHRHGSYLWDREIDTILVVDNDEYYCMDDENNAINKLLSKGFTEIPNEDEFIKMVQTKH